MKKVFINKFLHIVFLLSCIIFNNCSDRKGLFLEEFAVKDIELDSIVNLMIHQEILPNYVWVLELNKKDSVYSFAFSRQEQESVGYKYVYYRNKRIIGFINKNDYDIIVLSDINHKKDFLKSFYHFIEPVCQTKRFPYLFFPDNQYCDENMQEYNGIRIPTSGLLYEPTYTEFLNKKREFITSAITKKPYFAQ